MGLRNMIMGKYYCAQAHAHSSHSEVDKCNELFRMRNNLEHERAVQEANTQADIKFEEQRTLQLKYYAEAARDIRIAQMNAANNALTFNQDMSYPGNRAMRALPWHDTDSSYNRPQSRQITPSLVGRHSYSRPAISFGGYRPSTAMYDDGSEYMYSQSSGRRSTQSRFSNRFDDQPSFSRTSTWVASSPDPFTLRPYQATSTRRSSRSYYNMDRGSGSDRSERQSASGSGYCSSFPYM